MVSVKAMSEASDVPLPQNIYEEDINDDSTWDLTSRALETIPNFNSKLVCVLYLQNNQVTNLPDDFFPSLPNLTYLDLRDNKITDIPETIENHQSLTHLLLQNNKITSLPHELGTVNLKVLLLAGNPLMYPPREVINAGTSKVLEFLHKQYLDDKVELSDEAFSNDSDEECYAKTKGKCPKLARSRTRSLPSYSQSAKYLKPLKLESTKQYEKMKTSFLKDMALKKHKEVLAARDKVLQGRKNAELLKKWRKSYQYKQQFSDGSYKLERKDYPYDTSLDCMNLLTREDIEKDLPDKYKKRLVRKSKPCVPRKSNNDVHLAMKIKKLFENLEAIDLNREGMTPRTEQKVLMSEIKKISEIKQKLMELSAANTISVEDN